MPFTKLRVGLRIAFIGLILIPIYGWVIFGQVTLVQSGISTMTPTPLVAGTVLKDATDTEMVYIPDGQISLGINNPTIKSICQNIDQATITSIEDCELFLSSHSLPLHTLTIRSFWMDRYEVTVKQFHPCLEWPSKSCAETGFDQSSPQNDDQPQVGVDWYDAMYFCNSRGARLPTEVEWEYAARGDQEFLYPWGNTFTKSYVATYLGGLLPVGTIPQNKSWIGIYDLAGNAAEWVEDRYLLPSSTPIAANDGISETLRVTRGGGWDTGSLTMTTIFRGSSRPDSRSANTGFRCARSGPPYIYFPE